MNKLGALLCWAVVFADIGTSVYYTPGILFSQFRPHGQLAGLFVTMTMLAFVLLALKYAEVSVRFPEGGGVVTVSARALSPWMGALGGMFILVDYFLTAAISSISGLQYFQNVLPAIAPFVLPATILVIILLGILNWWGIKESAMVSLYIAIAAFISDIVVLIAVLVNVPLHTIFALIGGIFHGTHFTPVLLVTGFAGAFLAFSGLESISQLSPVMRRPRSKTVTVALSLVVITVGVTSPLLTILSTTLLDGQHTNLLAHPIAPSAIDPNQFISQLGGAFAGPVVGVATAIIASALLIFASNTAIIGSYHVFLALSRMSFFPAVVEKRDKFRDTPIVSIALATFIPIAILIAANGQINTLGELYAFGLLGAFSLTCVSLDALRIRERGGGKQFSLHEEEMEAEAAENARLTGGIAPLPVATDSPGDEDDEDELEDTGAYAASRAPVEQTFQQRAREVGSEVWKRYWPQVNFWLGLLTTVMVLTAWVTNLIAKRDATIFGSSLTVVGMAIAILHYRWSKERGVNTVQPSWAVSLAPDSVFAIVRTGLEQNAQIIESAFRAAHGRKVLVLFLSSHMPTSARIMQINDPALRDDEAQDAFRLAERLSAATHTPTQVFYRIGAVNSAASLWRVARSMEVVTDVETARAFAASVAPTYIRYRRVGDVNIAHLVIRPKAAATSSGALVGAQPFGSSRQTPPPRTLPAGERPPTSYDDDDAGSFYDETWSDVEAYRELEEGYSSARSRPLTGGSSRNGRASGPIQSGQNGRGAGRSTQGDERQFAEEPRPDHDHVGDTAPRHPVKIVHSLLPSQSGVIEAPRQPPRPTAPPAPAPRSTAQRMSEPTPIEADDEDWYWNGEDLVRYDETPATANDAKDDDAKKADGEQ